MDFNRKMYWGFNCQMRRDQEAAGTAGAISLFSKKPVQNQLNEVIFFFLVNMMTCINSNDQNIQSSGGRPGQFRFGCFLCLLLKTVKQHNDLTVIKKAKTRKI